VGSHTVFAAVAWVLCVLAFSLLIAEARRAELGWRALAWFVTRERVATWLLSRARRTPYAPVLSADGTEVYMERWWLFNPYEPGTYKARFEWCPISVRIHHIKHPDTDRHLHDHPWNARSIIFAGGYVEQRPGGRFFARRQGDTVSLKFGEYHRISKVRDEGALTLFITGRYRGSWGFWVEDRKVPWKEYERQ
jgi:hypothetical protein